MDLIPLSDIKIAFDQYNVELTDHPCEKEFEWQLVFSGRYHLSEDYQLDQKVILEYLSDLIHSGKIVEAPQSIVDYITIIHQPITTMLKSSQILLSILDNKSSIIRQHSYCGKLDNDMNIFDLLPEDGLLSLLLLLPARILNFLRGVNQKFKLLIEKYDLVTVAKFANFPRKSGQCYKHKFICQYDKKEKILDVILDSLYSKNTDLIRGDLIELVERHDHKNYRNHNIYVFDGCEIVDLYDDNIIPSEFTVINNNVPLYYWNRISEVMWFDHLSVKQQCIKNMKPLNSTTLCTTFIVNDTEYLITYEDNSFMKFRKLLGENILKFSRDESDNLNNILVLIK